MRRWLAGALVLFVSVLGWSGVARVWGDLGHKIVCEIAFQELNPKAGAESAKANQEARGVQVLNGALGK